ncbi:MAG: FAD-binding oxidoreductase [Thermodesulfobacteriota bacterium]
MGFSRIEAEDLTFLKSLVGSDRVSTGQSILDLHSRDESYHRGYRPDVVVWPKSTEEVVSILKYANERMIPVTPWGAGTSLEGNPLPVEGGMVLDFELMNEILAIRAEDFQVDVQPGVKYKDMNEMLARKGLFFAPDPGANATIGGMVANNASGVRTVKYGATRENVLRLMVVLPTGEVFHAGSFSPKRSSGYDLVRLLIGSEGTLGVITEITLRLAGIPEKFGAAIVTFDSVKNAADAVYEIMGSGLIPAALELLDPETIGAINKDGKVSLAEKPTLFLEFTGTSDVGLEEDLRLAKEISEDHDAIGFELGIGREERNRLWEARHEAYESVKRCNPGSDLIIADTAVPLSKYPSMVEYAGKTVASHHLEAYRFGHAGNGNLHLVIAGDLQDEEFTMKVNQAYAEIVSYAISVGGTATGEHGVGIGKKKFMVQEHGEGVKIMRRIKNLLDPNGILNPGKILPP